MRAFRFPANTAPGTSTSTGLLSPRNLRLCRRPSPHLTPSRPTCLLHPLQLFVHDKAAAAAAAAAAGPEGCPSPQDVFNWLEVGGGGLGWDWLRGLTATFSYFQILGGVGGWGGGGLGWCEWA